MRIGDYQAELVGGPNDGAKVTLTKIKYHPGKVFDAQVPELPAFVFIPYPQRGHKEMVYSLSRITKKYYFQGYQ